jgi:hypothetical protein
MSTQFDIEVTVHSKKQLKVLIQRMAASKSIKFLFSKDEIEKESGVIDLLDWMDNYEKYPNHVSASLAYYKSGYVVCLLIPDKLQPKVLKFLSAIKIPEKTDETPTIMESKKGKLVDLHITSLDPKKAEEIKAALSKVGVIKLDERPYYEQDPVY